MYRPEIRTSQINGLLDRVQRLKFSKYLRSIHVNKARQLENTAINFDFPVTAVIGPNGSGKSTVLALAACSHAKVILRNFFFYSKEGDSKEAFVDWGFQYLDQETLPGGLQKQDLRVTYANHLGLSESTFSRVTRYFGSNRIVPPTESPLYMRKRLSGRSGGGSRRQTTHASEELDFRAAREQAEKILGKPLGGVAKKVIFFSQTRQKRLKPSDVYYDEQLGVEITHIEKTVQVGKQLLYTSTNDLNQSFSEFNFGAGEAAVLRLVSEIEDAPEQSLVLIEELENGLHPLAVSRLVEYLIDVADRRRLQVIFTTHSEYALDPLPEEAIWACIDGKLIRGHLSITSLRALTSRFDTSLVIFSEDKFSKDWLEAIARVAASDLLPLIGFHFLGGDGRVIPIHTSHNNDPSVKSRSLCFIDGDSRQKDSAEALIFRLPGESPELEVFGTVKASLGETLALLTIGLHLPISHQNKVQTAVEEVFTTNRDPHLLFSQVGMKLGLLPEEIVKGAFFSIWCSRRNDYVDFFRNLVQAHLKDVNPTLSSA